TSPCCLVLQGVLYVGTSEGVVAVPVARCSGYRTCSQCVLARDPLCGWSRSTGTCTALVAGQHNLTQDLEDANIGQQCRGQTRNSLLSATEVNVHLNEAVRLQCSKPSNMASLSWSSSRSEVLPDHLFLRSADGSLSFLAAADTFGTYRCEAEEAGYREAVASYHVRQIAPPQRPPPRSFSPFPNAEKHHEKDSKDESYEDIFTAEPETSKTGYRDTETLPGVQETTDRSDASPTEGLVLNPRTDARSGGAAAVPEKSFYSELVVVSLLLAACVCALVLGGVHVWRQRKTGLKKTPLVGPGDGGNTNQSLESVPSLSSPEDAGPEVKVE
ncbi:semaphorin-4G-like, partial [Etheostoma cragini]|uniref:semaphorin-4G-like n=1 Tax=Etheostoma cragini TaxID=417921 RepID=UPI00155F1919